MSNEEKTTVVLQRHAQPIKVKLTRGARGQYRWEIENLGENANSVLHVINFIEDQLRSHYLQPGPNPTQQTTPFPTSQEDPHVRMNRALRNIKKVGEGKGPS